MIAATKPTIPASPKPCTSETMLSATPPTKGTFPPRSERASHQVGIGTCMLTERHRCSRDSRDG